MKYTHLQQACITNNIAELKKIVASKQNINSQNDLFVISNDIISDIYFTNSLDYEILDDVSSIDTLPNDIFISKITCTAVHIATYKNNCEALEILLAAGADFNAKSSLLSYTPLDIAIIKNNFDIVKILLDAGANPNIRAIFSNGRTPLHLASFYQQENIIKLLLEKGADPNLTVLHLCYKNEKLFNLFFPFIGEKVINSFFSYISSNENIMINLVNNIPLKTLVCISENYQNILGYFAKTAVEENSTALFHLIAAGVMPNRIYTRATTCALDSHSEKAKHIVKLLLDNYCHYKVTGIILKHSDKDPMKLYECTNCGYDINVFKKNHKVHRAGMANSYFCGEQQVFSLQEAARYSIRMRLVDNNLQITLKQAIECLPLPTQLKNYIYQPLSYTQST